jgi:hypothetical protein
MTCTKVNALCMTECPDTYSSIVSELITSLQGNSTIEKVRFAGEFLGGLSQQDQLALLGQVGQLRSLKRDLSRECFHSGESSKVVEAAEDLSVLSLGSVQLGGAEMTLSILNSLFGAIRP